MITPNRVYAQYQTKSKAKAWYEITPTIAQAIYDASIKVRQSYDIDLNEGEQLDVIGRVVVMDRSIIADIALPIYECNAEELFECGDDEIQCATPTVGADIDLSDDYFRVMLKSKIFKNNSDATIEGILTAFDRILSSDGALRLVDNNDMSYSVEFYGKLSPIERVLLLTKDLMPRPQGVKFSGFLHGLNYVECNSDGDYECGDQVAECVGFLGA